MIEGSSPEKPPPIDLYRIAVEEYRFQVDLNWRRTEHWFTLNVAIAGAAIALLRISNDRGTYLLVVGVFLCGALASLVAALAVNAQHEYYRQARDLMGKVATRMDLDLAIETTPGMRGMPRTRWQRWTRVTTLYRTLLFGVVALDIGGAVYGVCAAL